VQTTEPQQTTQPAAPQLSLEPGWNDIDGKRYYANQEGQMHIGWLKLDGESYYFRTDGTMVRGEIRIGQSNYHFDSKGRRIIMVNPWNPVPEDYVLDLVSLGSAYATEGNRVQAECESALKKMMNDCNRECPGVCVVSGYRSIEMQTRNFENRVQSFINQGYSEAEARRKTAERIAVPGTSEHHMGLAVDIVDTRLWSLEEEQEDLPAQKWLMEHCWEYGFILRYPKNKTDVTGIIYEPWHYRYVGQEVAKEIYDAGLTLEEYIQNLTGK
jgi:D-alanyl-D-alanine carboxypeptidase